MRSQKRRRYSSKKSSVQPDKKTKTDTNKSLTYQSTSSEVQNADMATGSSETTHMEGNTVVSHSNQMSVTEEIIRKVMGEMMESFTKTLKSELNDLKEGLAWTDKRGSETLKQCEENKDRTKALEGEIGKLKKDLELEKTKRLELESEQRKRNLIVYGLKETPEELNNSNTLEDSVNSWLVNDLKLSNIAIDNCFRLGKMKPEGAFNKTTTRPIKITFIKYADRTKVWQSKKLLKGTKVFVKEDLPLEIEKESAMLLPIFNAAKALGHKCNLVRNKLYINSQVYTINNLNTLPVSLQPTSIAIKTTDQEIFFWGKESKLSNMYPCVFKDGSTEYNCTEQYYACQKARFFEDKIAENKILQSSDPVSQKRTLVKGFNMKEWETVAEEFMLKGIRLKFTGNTELKNYLVGTYPKLLVEASPHDSIWGIGMGMHHPDLLNKGKWGKNLVGKILMQIRESML
jgi:hypothetical protein